ncbi:beta-ketoacyl reductase, partial [Frankia sp. R82]|uniref:beta-ketoacyl reductase n=1 Tax=Frankia sp. R82 TaxID=2950553 RepID=UPI0020444F28
ALAGQRLRGVVHAAGALADGVLAGLSPERLAVARHAKVTGAEVLDELTRSADLAFFLLFSSVSGLLGGAGQAAYACANSALDALAERRAALGLPATSVAWGPWAGAGMTEALDAPGLARLASAGLAPLALTAGLALFDAALACADPVVVAADLRPAADLDQASAPDLLRGLARGRPEHKPALDLTGLDARGRERAVADLVRTTAARVLGHPAGSAVPARVSFHDLGFDSLTSVELRNRLSAATGIDLDAGVIFDHPTSALLAAHLLAGLAGPAGTEDARVRDLLASLPLDRLRQAGLLEPLLALTGARDTAPARGTPPAAEELDALSGEDLLRWAANAVGER